MNETLKQDNGFVETIISIVCKEENIPMDQFHSKIRKREIVVARQFSMAFSKLFTNASLQYIGDKIGGRDHATVLHACKTIENLTKTDKSIRAKYDYLYKRIIDRNLIRDQEMIVCSICGHTNLTIRAWVNINTKKVIKEIELNEENLCYCDTCQAFVKSMTRHDYWHLLMEADRERIESYEYEQQLYKLEKQLAV